MAPADESEEYYLDKKVLNALRKLEEKGNKSRLSRCGLYDQAKPWSSQARRRDSGFEAKERGREGERSSPCAAINTGGAWCVRSSR